MNEEDAKAIIYPEIPELDGKDHKIAMLKYVIDRMWDKSMDLILDVAYNENVPDELRERAENFLNDDNFPDDTIDDEDLTKYAEDEKWSEYKKYLSNEHIGDCTAVACTCMRCYVESFYGLNTSPKNKHIGWEALHIVFKEEGE